MQSVRRLEMLEWMISHEGETGGLHLAPKLWRTQTPLDVWMTTPMLTDTTWQPSACN